MSIISKFKIIDTNILLQFPQILQQEQEDLIIATDVLRELDGLKNNVNPETAFQARRAAVMISRNLENLKFDNTMDKEKIPVDDKLMELTKVYAGTLITNDVYLKIKTRLAGLQTHGYGGVDEYTGVATWKIELDDMQYNAELERVLESKQPPVQITMKENEYLIIRNVDDDSVLKILVYRGGELHDVKVREIRNKWVNKIYPRPANPEQQCLFDALGTPSITIVYAGGPQGAG